LKGREEMGLEVISNPCPFSLSPSPALFALLLLATKLAPPQCQAGGQSNILGTGEQIWGSQKLHEWKKACGSCRARPDVGVGNENERFTRISKDLFKKPNQ
jgi:hypothetical protein